MIKNISLFSQSIGVKVGLNYTYVQPKTVYFGDGVEGYPLTFPSTGFLIGVSAEFPVNKIFTFNPEILFVRKHYDYHLDQIDNYTRNPYELDYLEFPLNIKYLKTMGRTKLYALAGLFGSVGLSAKKGIYATKQNFPYSLSIENRRGFKGSYMPSGDLGFNVGIGIEFKRYKYDFRYQHGGFCCGGPDKFKLRMFSVSMEYKLWTKKNKEQSSNELNE